MPLPSLYSGGYIGVLPTFAAAAQQNDNRASLASVIHAIARPEIHPHFKNAILKQFGRAEIACFEAANVCVDTVGCDFIQIVKPVTKWRTVIFRVFLNLKRTVRRV